jgi:hypothetical protein
VPFLIHRMSTFLRLRLQGWRLPLAVAGSVFLTSWPAMALVEPAGTGIAAPGTYWWYFLVTWYFIVTFATGALRPHVRRHRARRPRGRRPGGEPALADARAPGTTLYYVAGQRIADHRTAGGGASVPPEGQR